MATYNSTAWRGNTNTDALFRQNITTFRTGVTSVGLVRINLASDLDVSTVLVPTAVNQIRGGELYRFADTLQATAPVYIRFEYGGGNVATEFAIWVTVGNAYDATTGAITGFYRSAKWRLTGDTGGAAIDLDCLFSGDTNRLTFSLGGNHPSTEGFYGHLWLTIERLKDTSGADTANGIVWLGGRGYTGDQRIFWLPFTGNHIPPVCENNLVGVAPSGAATSTFGSNTGVFPLYPFAGQLLNPPIGFLAGMRSDFARGVQTPVTMYGVSRNYICACNNGNSYSMHGTSGPGGSRPLMLWE